MIPAEVIFEGWRQMTAERQIVNVSLVAFQAIVEWAEKNKATVIKGEDLIKAYKRQVKFEQMKEEDAHRPYTIALKTLQGLGYCTEFITQDRQHLKHPSGQEIDCIEEKDRIRLFISSGEDYCEYRISDTELRMTRPVLLPQMMASIIEQMKTRLANEVKQLTES